MKPVIILWSFAGLLNIIFPILSLDFTLVRKYSRVKTYIIWTVLTVIMSYHVKELIFQAGHKMRMYLFGPIISLVGFFMIMYTTNSIGIVPASFSFFLLYVPICTVYVVEFIHIFMSVSWATEAIKAGEQIRQDALTGLYNKKAFDETGLSMIMISLPVLPCIRMMQTFRQCLTGQISSCMRIKQV